jgi:hypothetical protein
MTQIGPGYDYEKMLTALRAYYVGAGYYGALIVLDLAKDAHTGTRKNGEPEFCHQVRQASYLRTIQSGVMYPEATHIVVLAHDMDEDYGISPADTCKKIDAGTPVYWKGAFDFPRIEPAMRAMNKKTPLGEAFKDSYFWVLGQDPIASVAKGLDNDDNVLSMIGAFTPEKQRSYLSTSKKKILPMLRMARKLFPAQEPVYQNLKHQLLVKMMLIEHHLSYLDRIEYFENQPSR